MFRLILKAWILVVWLFVGCLFAERIGALHAAQPARYPVNTTPNCRFPCWEGIVPGETSLDHTLTILMRHVRDTSDLVITDSHVNFQLPQNTQGYVRYQEDDVRIVRLENTQIPFWYLLHEMGAPDCVWRSRATTMHQVVFYWQEESAFTAAMVPVQEENASYLRATVDAIWMSALEDLPCDSFQLVPWMGVAPLWYYATS